MFLTPGEENVTGEGVSEVCGDGEPSWKLQLHESAVLLDSSMNCTGVPG